MTVKDWLNAALNDAERRGLPELKPMLEGLAKATEQLRTTDWNTDARDHAEARPAPDGR
jgi:hypothetical protein